MNWRRWFYSFIIAFAAEWVAKLLHDASDAQGFIVFAVIFTLLIKDELLGGEQDA